MNFNKEIKMSKDYTQNTDYDDYTNDIVDLDNDYGCPWYVDNFIWSEKDKEISTKNNSLRR